MEVYAYYLLRYKAVNSVHIVRLDMTRSIEMATTIFQLVAGSTEVYYKVSVQSKFLNPL
jgi:hypothetical protein